jgi:hypothetical protein
MSAAATAAGYLYASGRLRGKTKEAEGEERAASRAANREAVSGEPPRRARVRVALIPPQEAATPEQPAAPRPKRTPRIEYRVRRWRPDGE